MQGASCRDVPRPNGPQDSRLCSGGAAASATRSGPSSFVNTDLGHWRKRGSLTGMSALPPKADIRPKVLISAFGLSSVQLHIERRYIRRALEMKQDDDFSHEIGDRHQHDQLSH